MKKIVARLSVKESYLNGFLPLANAMIEQSRAEEGNIVYRMFQEIGQSNEIIVYEEYVNEQAIEHHNSSEHFKQFIASITDMLLEPPAIDVY